MTIRDLIHEVKTSYNAGVGSDDSRLRNRLVYAKIKAAYADLLADPRIKARITDFTRTTLDCVELQLATPYECELPVDLGCKVYRTKYKLPHPLSVNGITTLGPIKTISASREYAVVQHREATYAKKAKYSSNIDLAFIKNDYLYLLHEGKEELISVTMLPVDPFEVAEFKTFNSSCTPTTNCTSLLDAPYKIEPEIKNKLVVKAAEELVRHFSLTMKDNDNDGKETSKN